MTEITKKLLKQICKEQKLYSTPHINDLLYLHYKGFTRISNMEEYTGLKVLYLEGNGLISMKGLEHQTLMRCLYLQENGIYEIEGLEQMQDLSNLNLNQNSIEKIENLSCLPKLSTLLISKNQLKTVDSIRHLEECNALTCVDLQDNRIEDIETVDVLEKMPNLKVLYLKGNPFVKKIKNYRRVVLSRCKNLTYLDDRPVFPEERLQVEAWAVGGTQAEKEERERQKVEKAEKEKKNHEWFTEMLANARKEKEEERARRIAAGLPAEEEKKWVSYSNVDGESSDEESESPILNGLIGEEKKPDNKAKSLIQEVSDGEDYSEDSEEDEDVPPALEDVCLDTGIVKEVLEHKASVRPDSSASKTSAASKHVRGPLVEVVEDATEPVLRDTDEKYSDQSLVQGLILEGAGDDDDLDELD